jgi:putative glutathione S-transferase
MSAVPAAAPHTALAEVSASGAFARSASPLVGRLGSADFPAEGGGRYVLYVSYACPWASRVLAALALKGLEREVAVVVCAPTWRRTRPEGEGEGADGHRGWVFRARAAPGSPDAALAEVPEREPLFVAETVREVYERCVLPPGAATVTKFTVPLLVDSRTRRAVCNESSLLLRDLGGALFDACGAARFPGVDLCPPALAAEVEAVSESFYGALNDGVYRCGFARSQAAYEAAAREALAGLRAVEARLARPGGGGFLVGGRLTEADVRLFVTLVRWDPVYAVHFKTSFASVRASPTLLAFLRRIHGARGGAGGATVGEASVRLDHIKQHYFGSHEQLNPFSLVPLPHPDEGSELLLDAGAPP